MRKTNPSYHMKPHRFHSEIPKVDTSWELSKDWYKSLVGLGGHYYHTHVIVPNSLRLLELNGSSSLIDLGCGQGVLARRLPKAISYLGVDGSPGLINFARTNDRNVTHRYEIADLTKPFRLPVESFTHAACLLVMQNVEKPQDLIKNTSSVLKSGGSFLIVLNHPCFRIPRQSHWEMDPATKIQYRRIDRYLTSLKIPIKTHPARGHQSQLTWSFHQPLSFYSNHLRLNGFSITTLEEWTSDKKSEEGPMAKPENRARDEFPLFLALLARKN